MQVPSSSHQSLLSGRTSSVMQDQPTSIYHTNSSLKPYWWLVLGWLLLSCLSVSSQTIATTYTFTSGTATYTPLSGATLVIAGSNGTSMATGTFNDEAVVGPFNIGFNFCFDG